ncbi:unnamed protein product [Prunus armeniaca]
MEDASDHTPMQNSGFVDGLVMEGRSGFGSVSFRDKLMDTVNLAKNVGIDVNSLEVDYDDLNDETDVVVACGERGPSIQFSERAMDRLCKPWKNALIIKLLGRSHTYNYLHARLQQKWSLKWGWKLVDLVNDYFVVKFELEEDLNFVLTGGLRIIVGQVSALQLECFNVWSLKRIGNLLGKLLKIDSLTTSQNRAVNSVESNARGSDEGGMDHMATDSGTKDAKDMLAESGLRGSWMIVQPRRNVKAPFRYGNGKGYGDQAKGSRFAALRQVNDDFGRAEVGCDVEQMQNYSKPASSAAPFVDFSPKVWTKSQRSKNASRLVLNDISTHSVRVQRKGGESGRKIVGGNKTLFGGTTIKERFGTMGEKVNTKGIVNDQIASWVNENDISKEKGVYFFGHQPPNIQEEEESVMGSFDSDDDEEQLLSSVPGSQNKVEQMDLFEGQGNVAKEQLTDNTFDNVGVGFSGGLWLMWDDSRVHLDIIGTSDQSIIASGDFNEMLGVDDKLGGASVNRLKGFKRWFGGNNMMDLGFSGPKFTWRNNKVFERLDHAICNMKWRHLFPEGHVRHLPRTTSDHNLIKVSLQSNFCASFRPFRFEAMWLKHEHFNDLIVAVWGSSSGSAVDKTLNLIKHLKNWNSTIFSHLRQKKAILLARLDEIQRALCRGPNYFLKQLEIFLMDDFNEVLDHEALFWKQKSRINWLQGGDRNTKFFHLTAVIRRRRNKIKRLKNNDGLLVEKAAGIKALAVEYFSGQFNQVQVAVPDMVLPNLFPGISNDDLALLGKNIELDEVKESLFNIGSLKAPGVDGFPACFYQSQWDHCSSDIYALVIKAFTECKVPEKLNYTVITLVPKVTNPHTMVQFMPISLCSTLYKVISKIIVARLRLILPCLISLNQVSFVLSRHITDNILITQELMHKFKLSKGKKGFVTWKIDLSKAYDRLNWNFVKCVLLEVGLPTAVIPLIMHCVSTASGQVVNYDKSAILCSPNTPKAIAKEISFICGYPIVASLGNYLGMPLLHSRPTYTTYNGLIDRVTNRLASWKSKLLSIVGRATLVQAVTSSIPIYAMQTVKLHASVYEHLDRLNRNFFLGGKEEKNKAKYLKGASILDSPNSVKKSSSRNWKCIVHGVELLLKGMRWRIGSGDQQDFIPWLKVNLLSKAKWGGGLPWSAVFVFTCWYLWKWRNKHIFLPLDEYVADPIKTILMVVRDWVKASQARVKMSPKARVLLSWEPPGLGMFKLNVDCSRRAASGCIGAGRVICGANGNWICGFVVNLGKGQILEAELWGLYFGLHLACDKGISNLLVEMDVVVVVSLVQQASTLSCHPFVVLIQSCCALMRRIGNCHLAHVYREMNVVADRMANWSFNLDLGVSYLDEAPAWVSSFLEDDFLGVVRPRLIYTS